MAPTKAFQEIIPDPLQTELLLSGQEGYVSDWHLKSLFPVQGLNQSPECAKRSPTQPQPWSSLYLQLLRE